MSDTRELGIITSASVDTDQFTSVWVQVEYDQGGSQGFGGLALNEEALREDYIHDLLDTFDKPRLAELVGQRVWVLRRRPDWQARIEGLTSVATSRRFTHTDWQRKHGFEETPLAEGEMDWSRPPPEPPNVWERLMDDG
jgi:hypothetical protein